MENKNIYTLAALLLLLVGIWYGQQWWKQRQELQTSAVVQMIPELDSYAVDEILIQQGDNQLRLVEQDALWLVAGEGEEATQEANMVQVEQLLGVLDGLEARLVSTDPGRHASLGVTEEEANQLIYRNEGEEQYRLLISSTNSGLFRQSDRSNVYEWNEDYQQLITTSVPQWLAPTPTPTTSDLQGEATLE